jgi:hypothetical protein
MNDDKRLRPYYYKVRPDDSDPQGVISTEWDLRGVDRWIVYKGIWIENWPENVTFYAEGEHLEDYLFCALHGWILVSDRARRAIETCSTDGVQFLSIRIVHKPQRLEPGPYWLLNVVRQEEALDWERTRWLHPDRKEVDERPILDILREALSLDTLRGVDIFRLKVKGSVGQVYISPYLKQCLEAAEAIKGFKFIPIRVY